MNSDEGEIPDVNPFEQALASFANSLAHQSEKPESRV